MTSLATELRGAGAGLPLAPDSGGRLPFAAGIEKVRQSILIILDTEPGERVMLPEFGAGLRRFLMRPNTGATRAEIERTVAASLERWEARIKSISVEATPGDDPAVVLLTISWSDALTGRRDALLYALPLR